MASPSSSWAAAQAQLRAKGVHLSDKFFSESRGDAEQLLADASALYEEALNCDLRRFGEPALRSDLHAAARLDDPICLQLLSAHNIAQPSARQSTPGLHPQLLQLRLTDGAQKVTALEMSSVPQLSVSLAPGTKLLVQNCPVRNGKLLLSSANCSVLGGRVHELFTSWKANKELKEKTRLAGTDKADPPPSFTEFVVSQKKAAKNPPKDESKKTPKHLSAPSPNLVTEKKKSASNSDACNQAAAANKKKSKEGDAKQREDGARAKKPNATKHEASQSASVVKQKKQNPHEKQQQQQKVPSGAQEDKKLRTSERSRGSDDKEGKPLTGSTHQLRVGSKEFIPSFLMSSAGAPSFPPPPPPAQALLTATAKPEPSVQKPKKEQQAAGSKRSAKAEKKPPQAAAKATANNDGKSAPKSSQQARKAPTDAKLKDAVAGDGVTGEEKKKKPKQKKQQEAGETNGKKPDPEKKHAAAAAPVSEGSSKPDAGELNNASAKSPRASNSKSAQAKSASEGKEKSAKSYKPVQKYVPKQTGRDQTTERSTGSESS